MKYLAVFDFDHTVINENSDTAVIDLIGKHNVPNEIKQLHKIDGWTAFMQGIFHLLYNNKISKNSIKNKIEELTPVPGMCELIHHLHEHGHDIVILSDSNSYFIDIWLKKNNLIDKVLKVLTNPADFDENGLLKISMYHYQESCKLSTKNLCKGQIMEDFVAKQVELNVIYDKIIYLGDGSNDFCPLIRLEPKDWACVRNDYKCAEIIKKEENKEKVKANLCLWSTGFDVINAIKI